MTDARTAPDNTAVRVALWRALHVEIDPPPHVVTDVIGLELADPEPGWHKRRDMNPRWTSRNRASIVARARFVEDLVIDRAGAGCSQYVILGTGLDTFAQRQAPAGLGLQVFEVDQPATQAWKQDRLEALGYVRPEWLHFVPVDFEAGESWPDRITSAGFDRSQSTVVASTGVSVYLTREAIVATLGQVAALGPGSVLAMSFMIPLDQVDADERGALQGAERGARAGGTPWLSFFTPEEMVALARAAGFSEVRHVSDGELAERYFAGRADGLRPSSAEQLIVASV